MSVLFFKWGNALTQSGGTDRVMWDSLGAGHLKYPLKPQDRQSPCWSDAGSSVESPHHSGDRPGLMVSQASIQAA